MVNRPRSITLAACIGAALGFAQTGTITPNSILDGTRAAQVEAPKPALSAEARGDILMARKMSRGSNASFRSGSPNVRGQRNTICNASHRRKELGTARQSLEATV